MLNKKDEDLEFALICLLVPLLLLGSISEEIQSSIFAEPEIILLLFCPLPLHTLEFNKHNENDHINVFLSNK